MAPAGAPVPGCPTSMRMTCGAPGGSAACRTLAAAITSITMNGGALAPRPIFNMSVVELDAVCLHARPGLGAGDRRDARRSFDGAPLDQPVFVSGRQRRRIDPILQARRCADIEFAGRCVAADDSAG